ncbi:4'-phosphopantetheinyl transferase family protein [Vibrio sp. WJH972]
MNAIKQWCLTNIEGVDVWLFRPDEILDFGLFKSQFFHLLSADEQRKFEAIKREQKRREYLFTRVFVRHVLSRYCSLAAGQLVFSKESNGKPYLSTPERTPHFNLSHTKGLLVCAVSDRLDVGIDVENITRTTDFESIASQYFSNDENNRLNTKKLHARKAYFYELWTLKEAYLKALGIGISVPLKSINFYENQSNGNKRVMIDDKGNTLFEVMKYGEEHLISVCARQNSTFEKGV